MSGPSPDGAGSTGSAEGAATDGAGDPDLAEVVRRELALLVPAHRTRPDVVRSLLHDGFVEVGASGRWWDRQSVVASLAAEDAAGPAVEASQLVPLRLADDVVLLTYLSRTPARTARRCSVWVRDPERGWVVRYHQGTPVPPDVAGGTGAP